MGRGVGDAAAFGETWKEGEEVGKGKSSEEIPLHKGTLHWDGGGEARSPKPREALPVHKPAGDLRYSPERSMQRVP